MRHKQSKGSAAQPVPTVYVSAVRRSWLRREIRLSGDVEAVIGYDARWEFIGGGGEADEGREFGSGSHQQPTGGEASVNGIEIGRLHPSPLIPNHYFLSFDLRFAGGVVPVSVRAALSSNGFVRLSSLKLTVAGVTLYEERDGKGVVMRPASTLPISAGSDQAHGGGRPIPGSSDGEPLPEGLPPGRKRK